MSWIGALAIVVAVYLAANIVLRRFGLFSSALNSEMLRELIDKAEGRPILLDVRTSAEYRQGHIPTAVNIPHDSIASRPPKAAPETVIVVYCQTGSRSLVARRTLMRLGYTNVVNFGPLRRWKEELIAGPDPGAASDGPPADTGGRVGSERDGR